MKQILLSLMFISFALGCNSDQQMDTGIEAEIITANAAIKEFAGALQAELKAAMQAGGPVAAIGICSMQAMPITQRIGTEKNLFLSRTSLKIRNPANTPSAWQTEVLEDFEHQKAAGKDIGSLAWSEIVRVDGQQEFRYMKAIPTGAVCLQCHGTALSTEVSQTLAGLYPEDHATGFREGDIRGAFVVVRELSD